MNPQEPRQDDVEMFPTRIAPEASRARQPTHQPVRRTTAAAPTASPSPFGLPPLERSGLFPQLDILGLLGQGGMGAVYKAKQRALDRLVAVKVLPPTFGQGPEAAKRFTREARALARLNHPNIVTVYDFGSVAIPASWGQPEPASKRSMPSLSADTAAGGGGSGGTPHGPNSTPPTQITKEPTSLMSIEAETLHLSEADEEASELFYIVMEFIEGANLRQTIQGRRLHPRDALSVIMQVCDALQYAHDEGVVHRDIKPANIIIDTKGRVKIVDFGLAKLGASESGVHHEDQTLTQANVQMGTPKYMAPEQVEGAHVVDHRADLYSLGVVFYEMLTGELPLGRFALPSRKAAIDNRLDDVVLRILEKDPEERFQQASDIKSAIEDIHKSSDYAALAAAASSAGPNVTPPAKIASLLR